MWRLMGPSSRGLYYVIDYSTPNKAAPTEAFVWPLGKDWANLGACILMMDMFNMRDYGKLDEPR